MKHIIALTCVCLLTNIAAFAQEVDSAKDPGFEQSWQLLTMQGQRIGYATSSSREVTRNGVNVIETDTTTMMKMQRFGQTISIKQVLHVEETPEGKFLGFTSVMDNPPNSRTSTIGEIDGDVMQLTNKAGESARESTVTGMNELVSPAWADKYLESPGLKIGESVEFETYEPQMGKKTTIKLERLADQETKVFSGEMQTLKRIVLTQTVLPGVKTEMYLDDKNNAVKTVIPLMGMVAYEVSEEEALKAPTGEEVDFALDTLVKVDQIDAPHQAKEIVYRIEVEGANVPGLFTDDDTQDIKVIDDNEIDLTVRALKPVDSNVKQATVENEYLKSSLFLECKAPAIVAMAEAGDDNQTAPAQIATALESYVQQVVKEKNFSTSMATALEVANSKAGDCSEHAVLLAALLRAKNIPSRVVVGFVYSQPHSAFVGHMWTEAWLSNQWIPLDGTLGQGGIGAGHLKVTTSSLADDNASPGADFIPLMHLLGRTKISVVSRK